MTKEKFLGNIALAFSGGGFRAASFSLGVLDYLGCIDHPEDGRALLHHVTFLSSASGGTIATALYSLHQARGSGFAAFYKQLHERLSGTGLLNNVMDILNRKNYWDDCPHKSRNLINAFSLAYKADLFGAATIGDISAQGVQATGLHLEEVCFNTTDFYNGLLFRQNTKMKADSGRDPKFRYGNSRYYLLPQTAAHIRLADILAASSCFPGGFEPITFPPISRIPYNPERLPLLLCSGVRVSNYRSSTGPSSNAFMAPKWKPRRRPSIPTTSLPLKPPSRSCPLRKG